MLPLLFFLLIVIGGIAAGVIGSLTGLGGAVILTPVLVLGFGIPIYYAAGASLILLLESLYIYDILHL